MPGLNVQTVVDAIANAVRRQVLAGQLNPDDRVTEKDIAELYEVSRPTAKAAIERLIEVGLLRRSGNKTAHIPRLTLDEIVDIYRCRALIEGEAVESLARSRSVPRGALAALATEDADANDWSAADRIAAEIEFQRALVDGFGSPRLSRMHDILIAEAHLCMMDELDGKETLAARHAPLISAIKNGDGALARKSSAAVSRHWENCYASQSLATGTEAAREVTSGCLKTTVKSRSWNGVPRNGWTQGLCCTNSVRDLFRKSSRVAGVHEQTRPPDLRDRELASL